MEYYDDDPTMMEEEEEEEEEEEGYRSQTLSDSEDETPVDKKNKAEHFRRVLLPAIQSRVTALGGLEDVVYRRPRADYQRPEDASSDFDEVEDEDKYEEFTIKMYKLGDEALGCLKDLKKFWKMDDSDDERSISKLFFETGVLKNDLLNILNLAGLPGSSIRHEKAALAAADLIAAMTWPINALEELKEVELMGDKKALEEARKRDYSTLINHQRVYKANILKSGAIKTLFRMLMPRLNKGVRDRTERDENVVNLILHILRNLAAIRDRALSSYHSADAVEEAHLQSELITQFGTENVFDVLITISSLADKTQFNQWNMICLEIFFLLFRGVEKPDLLVKRSEDATKVVREEKLNKLLEAETSRKKLASKSGLNSRHSRFGTTVVIENRLNSDFAKGGSAALTGAGASKVDRIVMHKQASISTAVLKNPGKVLDANKKRRRPKEKRQDDLGVSVEMRPEAVKTLQNVAVDFLESAFNPFFESVMRDIRMERAKVREIDNTRFLFLVRFFLEFFLAQYEYEKSKGIKPEDDDGHDFNMVAEMTEATAIAYVIMRMQYALAEQPPLWTELHAAVDCFVQMLLTIDGLYYSGNTEYREAAEVLQNKLYYEPDTLDTVLAVVRSYKDQPLKYLDATMHLAYVLLRMLEKYSKNKEFIFVRKRASRRKKKDVPQRDAQPDGSGDEEEEAYNEEGSKDYKDHQFKFNEFEIKFATDTIAKTLITYLSGYKDFSGDEQMKRCVNLLHRAAVKAQSETLFFKATTLALFRRILDDRALLPKTSAYNDLGKLITFILKKFFKLAQENPLLLLEVFYPHTKGEAKLYLLGQQDSDYDSDGVIRALKMPAELQIKGNYTWSQQLGIAIAKLSDSDRLDLITWVKDTIIYVSRQRDEIITEIEFDRVVPKIEREDDEDEEAFERRKMLASTVEQEVSEEAKAALTDFNVIYDETEIQKACTFNSELKLLLGLVKWESAESSDRTYLQWTIPARLLPKELASYVKLIDDFLIEPLDIESGKSLKDIVKRKLKRRAPRRAPESDLEELPEDEDDDVVFSDPEVQAAMQAGRRRKGQNNGRKSRKKGKRDGAAVDGEEEDERATRRRRKRIEEAKIYRSAEFILDSDEDEEADRAFFEREAELRKQMEFNAGKGNGLVDHQTKKQKDGSKTKKKIKEAARAGSDSDDELGSGASQTIDPGRAARTQVTHSSDSENDGILVAPSTRPRPRPVPKAALKGKQRSAAEPINSAHTSSDGVSSSPASSSMLPAKRSRAAAIESDEGGEVDDSDEQNSPQSKRPHTGVGADLGALSRGRRVVMDSDDEEE